MADLSSRLGTRLYDLLPAVYRERDNSTRNANKGVGERLDGDLGRYLQAAGVLFDGVYATLQQRLADAFPDNPLGEDELACQEWLLPYFARLLDVRLVSPHAEGQRDEISNAIAWRQRKGTRQVVEAIAEAVAQMEAELHEGWQRVAITPRVGTPLLSARYYGYTDEPARGANGLFRHPVLGARHPGLPAATVDVRCPARALRADPANPAARNTLFDVNRVHWRQGGYHGAPCFPGHFDDVSRRTVDVRTPDWARGHYHPRRVLLYVPPPAGFFLTNIDAVVWDNRADPAFQDLFEELVATREVDGVSVPLHVYRNKTLDADEFKAVRITGVITLAEPGIHRFEGLILNNALKVTEGYVELVDCAARRIEIETADTVQPVLDARDSLIKSAKIENGLSRLEYCTVLAEFWTQVIQASDALFLGRLRGKSAPITEPPLGCVRYSRIPPEQDLGLLSTFHLTRAGVTLFAQVFGQRGCGVLHPATHISVRAGAEDGGELGAYHRRRYSLAVTAVYRKLQDFLPLGQEAVVIPDVRLLHEPPVA